ncbi:CoA-transferase family III domain-containing protein [Crassisporium funariophilum]|nr:CoA-transferase family III domain-containing protein [Crassisporium funariophilum]
MTAISNGKLYAHEAVRNLWLASGLPENILNHLILAGNPDTAVPSSFRIGVAAQTAIALSGLSAAYLHRLRSGDSKMQDVTVDARHAVLSCHSEAWYTIDDHLPAESSWDTIAGLYKTADDNWVRIHTNFPHHRAGVLTLLGIADDPQLTKNIVAEAILQRNSQEFETECAARGMCVTAFRSSAEWDAHEQAKALLGVPPVLISKVREAPRQWTFGVYRHRSVANNPRPLSGFKVLDLSRVLAGPIAGRTLAAHGADVLLVTSPTLPSLPALDMETSMGKRTAQLDLNLPRDVNKLDFLVNTADVFLQAYRPGGLDEKGFGVEDVLGMRSARDEGVVYASLRAWGWEGGWKGRRGFDSLVQTATGFNADEAEAYKSFTKAEGPAVPRPLPLQALDHAAAYFLAFGINVALCKRITLGGSWEVRVSLAAVGQWIRSLGRMTPEQAFGGSKPLPPRSVPQDPEISALCVDWQQSGGGKGRMRALRHAAILSETPVREGVDGGAQAPMRLDSDEARWI